MENSLEYIFFMQRPKAKVVVINNKSSADKTPKKGDILEAEDDAERVVDDFDIEQAASSLLAKGRQLPQTDHTKVYYRPFRKDFYVEVPELARMTKKEVEQYRTELDEIKVRGNRCPKPIKNWAQCGVELKILNCLKRLVFLYFLMI